jgi:hypothetical protein
MRRNSAKLHTSILGATIAAAAVPTMLFAGTGSAHADTWVSPYPNPLGVRVVVTEDSGKAGWCTYTATPQGSGVLPFSSLPFRLEAKGRYEFLIPGVPTGTKWIPQVNCDHGANKTDWPGAPNPIVY